MLIAWREIRGNIHLYLLQFLCVNCLLSAVKPAIKRPKSVEYPCTPPPSPRVSGSPASMYREDNLVHIKMVLVDKDAPNFLSHYEGVSIP